jgi:CheY-like chemotaxis protein
MSPKLLIIDDELSIQRILSHFLGSDYIITTKNNGLEAMEWLESGNMADLIILDLNMP